MASLGPNRSSKLSLAEVELVTACVKMYSRKGYLSPQLGPDTLQCRGIACNMLAFGCVSPRRLRWSRRAANEGLQS